MDRTKIVRLENPLQQIYPENNDYIDTTYRNVRVSNVKQHGICVWVGITKDGQPYCTDWGGVDDVDRDELIKKVIKLRDDAAQELATLQKWLSGLE